MIVFKHTIKLTYISSQKYTYIYVYSKYSNNESILTIEQFNWALGQK